LESAYNTNSFLINTGIGGPLYAAIVRLPPLCSCSSTRE